ncbi:MAG TPA: hypothetical protein IGS37_18710 [Synechococcales cyanobacterium M55_K2018_004]|nr:hypothetical protein [Synechococcales cyanobacterium M55_K2018_004]
MASPNQVREYLAYWFQLGKPVVFPQGQEVLPQPVYQGDRYSPAFEDCWQKLQQPDGQNAYLAGTNQTIGALLSSAWDITPCARCNMPVPMLDLGMRTSNCPCNDLPNWPDNNLPAPRSPVSSQDRLSVIRDRLLNQNS